MLLEKLLSCASNHFVLLSHTSYYTIELVALSFVRHHQSEEIYHITAGSGTMQLVGKGHFTVHVGDTICIDPGTEYNIINTSDTTALKIIAMSSPPFQPNDTVI